jgi:hypothetical protein
LLEDIITVLSHCEERSNPNYFVSFFASLCGEQMLKVKVTALQTLRLCSKLKLALVANERQWELLCQSKNI